MQQYIMYECGFQSDLSLEEIEEMYAGYVRKTLSTHPGLTKSDFDKYTFEELPWAKSAHPLLEDRYGVCADQLDDTHMAHKELAIFLCFVVLNKTTLQFRGDFDDVGYYIYPGKVIQIIYETRPGDVVYEASEEDLG